MAQTFPAGRSGHFEISFGFGKIHSDTMLGGVNTVKPVFGL
jgi:hypothetical protein